MNGGTVLCICIIAKRSEGTQSKDQVPIVCKEIAAYCQGLEVTELYIKIEASSNILLRNMKE